MHTPPAGVPEETWEHAVSAGFHATTDATRSEVAEILAAALPVLEVIPRQTRSRTSDSSGSRSPEHSSR